MFLAGHIDQYREKFQEDKKDGKSVKQAAKTSNKGKTETVDENLEDLMKMLTQAEDDSKKDSTEKKKDTKRDEKKKDTKKEDKPKYGSVRHREIIKMEDGKDKGVLVVAADWIDNNGRVLLKEVTTFTISGDQQNRFIERSSVCAISAFTRVSWACPAEG